MKKFAVVFVVMLVMVLSASFVSAGNNDIDINVKAKGGDANAQADANAAAAADARAKSLLINYEAKNFITAPLLSAFVTAPTSELPKGWKQIVCDPEYKQFTIGQLKNMADGGSFFNRRGEGIFSFLVKRVITSVRFYTSRNLTDDTVVRVVNRAPGFGGTRSGSTEGRGDFDSPVDQIMAEAVLDLVLKTGSTNVIIFWDYVEERRSTAGSVGIGTSGSSSAENAMSLTLGFSSGSTSTTTKITYFIKAVSYEGVDESAFSCADCDVTKRKYSCTKEELQELLNKIEINREKIYGDGKKKKGCDLYCLNNLKLRLERGRLYYEIYRCTGDHESLNEAIRNYEVAARNYTLGGDISKNEAEAERIIAQVLKNWEKAKQEVK